jgi:hypothetical protein
MRNLLSRRRADQPVTLSLLAICKFFGMKLLTGSSREMIRRFCAAVVAED